MAHEVIASVRIFLPEPPREMTDKLAEIASAWSVLLDQVKPADGNTSFSVNETRAKAAPKKRGRPPANAPTPLPPMGLSRMPPANADDDPPEAA